ncbi:hypothetical protein Pmani_027532 [Petrolisthes manimaculis]|uniref:Regulatory protein zeste n=1 Tax=Petrolisthes manimaculis TaxID=1843537 RepID=A0AAE1P2I0_9EUCA|nr:hypothetical protein Pmani_027532 [Petrolisthes manimaculis]
MSAEPPQKKIRRPNFSENELLVLITEVRKRKQQVIKNKFDSGVTVSAKTIENAWDAICEEVNSVSKIKRITSDVRKKFRDMRSHVKSRRAKENKETKKTGGGKKKPMVYTPAEEAMLALLESEAWGLKELPDSQEEISEAAPSVSMVATSAPVASISAAAAVPSTSMAEYIDETVESHIVDVLISIDVPDAEEELAVEHSYSFQSPAFKSFTQPRSRPASRPASCPDGRPASCPASRPASCPAGRPAICPAGRPASCPASRPASRSGFATRRSAASGNEQELVANMLQVQKTISDNVEKMENHLEVIASSVVSIAASMQEIASAVKTVSN